MNPWDRKKTGGEKRKTQKHGRCESRSGDAEHTGTVGERGGWGREMKRRVSGGSKSSETKCVWKCHKAVLICNLIK